MRLPILLLTSILLFSYSNVWAQNPAANERAVALLKYRKAKVGVPLSLVMESLASEQENNLVWLATGMFISQDDVTAEQMAQVLVAAQGRESCFHQIAAQVALSKQTLPCIDLLLAEKALESKLAGATVMAIRAQLDLINEKNASGSRAKKEWLEKIDFTAQARLLLGEKKRELVELAILTAAHCGAELDEEVDAVQLKKSPAVDAVKVLYNAKRGRPLPDVSELISSRIKSDRKFQKMSSALSTFQPTTHPFCYIAQAAGIAEDSGQLEFLHQSLGHKDIRVQIDAAAALEELGDDSSVDPLLASLPKACWPVKIRIYSAIGAIPAKRSMPVLLEQLADEPGRLRLDCTYALASIIGYDVGGNAEAWKSAWDEAAVGFEVNLPATQEFRKENDPIDMTVRSLGSFYDLGIYSSKFLYVVDTSASMKGERIEDLERNLSSSAADLKEPAKFNIVMFGGEISVASDRLVTATQGNYIANQIGDLKLSYATRTYDAIHMAGQFDEADTIYFLSDGAPVSGSFGKWFTIIPAYRFLHRYRPVAMFTVPYDAGSGNEKAMKRFATENFGKCGGLNDGE